MKEKIMCPLKNQSFNFQTRMDICFENNLKHTNTLCEQKTNIATLTTSSAFLYHWDLNR
jgi:hypothetical protein